MSHVSISDQTPREVYSVGSTPQADFTIPWPFFALDTDIAVYVDGVQITYSATPADATQFSVAGTAVDGGYQDGTVTLGATVTNATVIVQRIVPISRTEDFPYPSNTLDIQSLNTGLDRLFALLQQIDLKFKRALRLDDGDETTEVILPDVDTRKGKTLIFDPTTGAPLAGEPLDPGLLVVSAFIETLLDDTDAGTARNTLGFGNSGNKGTDLASASSVSLPTGSSATKDYFHVTGTTGITAISSRQAGSILRLVFDDVVPLTHSASLILAGAVSRSTVANEAIDFVSEGSGVWREKSAGGQSNVANSIADGRLTLATGVALMGSTSYLAKTTIYYTPYIGNRIALYNGSAWVIKTFSELSLSLAGLAASTNFDVFLYDNAGTLTLESVAWTNDTTRATAIVRQDGVYVKSGTPTKRLVGTFRTTSTIGQCEWRASGGAAIGSPANLLVSNAQNRVAVSARATDDTNSWTYSTASYRSADNSTSNRVGWVQCLDGLNVRAAYVAISQSSGSSISAKIGVKIDATNSADGIVGENHDTTVSTVLGQYDGAQAAGYHFAQAVELASGATITFFGDNGSSAQSGLTFRSEM